MSVYLQPRGILFGQEGLVAQKHGYGLSLAGQDTAFSLCEVITRDNGKEEKTLYAISDLKAHADPQIQHRLNLLSQPRPNIAGLCFDKPIIMGVVNVTPDSFSDGGRFDTSSKAIAQGRQLRAQGADIIDIGGESTRPGAQSVEVQTEIERVIPVIKALSDEAICSIDSRNAAVMKAALEAGAKLVNDVTALTYDEKSLPLIAQKSAPVILMHSRISPQNEAVDMSKNPSYQNVSLDVFDYLERQIQTCLEAGIERSQIIIDPGIGFGKTLEDNLALLKDITLFHGLGVPVLVGLSRKRFIGIIGQEDDPARRDPGSVALSLEMIKKAVQIVRVHNVADMKQGLDCILKTYG